MEPRITYLEAPIRTYAWGSHTTLADLQGRPTPTREPEAEIWYGAHPLAPSLIGRESGFVGLDAYIAMDPRKMLGPQLLSRFGDQLPFLLKILAVERPLSIQAHPDRDTARRGFMEETRRRIPLAAPQRTYRDPRPKPELVCALSPFSALVGFRPAADIRTLQTAWGLPGMPLEQLVGEMLRDPAVGRMASQWARHSRHSDGVLGEATALFRELDALYPDDPGLGVAMLLNRVELQPGEALFLGPGLMHAYLHGTAVEVMGNSDNTLRGGLTQKYIDVPGLLAVVAYESRPPEILRPHPDGPEAVYQADTPMFRLSVLDVDGTLTPLESTGPDILLCTEGAVTVAHGRVTVELGPGEACFVPHACSRFALSGKGRVYRARTGI